MDSPTLPDRTNGVLSMNHACRFLSVLIMATACCTIAPAIAKDATDHWAFQTLVNPPPPAVTNQDWLRTPIDNFIAAAHARQGFIPAAPAEKRTLIRRATFDLTGLAPTPAEVATFLADTTPGAFATVVNRLLESPQYGVRWGRHWLDAVRYTDYLNADPLKTNKQPLYELYQAYRYRDWVVDALNTDVPYDQFIVHQIAGDLIPNPNGDALYPEGLIATTVLSIGFWENGCADKKKVVSDIVDDQIDVVGQAFLGLTLSCARCHDHKFDPVTQEDYYGLAGIFYSSRVLESVGNKGDHTKLLRVPLVEPEYLQRRQQAMEALAVVKKEIEQLQTQIHAGPATMVAYYDFENSEGTKTTKDRIGGYVGTLHGNAVIGEGKFGHGITLDGDGDFVDGTAQPGFQVTCGTVMAWFHYDRDISSEGQIVGLPFDVSAWTEPYYGLQAWISPDGNALGAQANHNGARLQTVNAPGVKPLEWHHIAASYDGQFVRVFVDGQLTGSVVDGGSADGKIQYRGNPNLTIGTRNVLDPGNFFKGKIDEVKLFDQPLNSIQIQAAMQFPEPPDFARNLRGETTSSEREFAIAKLQRRVEILEQQAAEIEKNTPPEAPLAMAIQEGGTPDSLFPGIQDVPLHVRGRYNKLAEVIPRRMPEFFAGTDQPPITSGSGRWELAQWIASGDNPLTARVIVNRVWQHHFGKGLVHTPNNFGQLGEPPTHPELLDWLATWLVDHDWSLKELHRLIMLSATYRQSSLQDEETIRRDPGNRLLARMTSRRLEAEPIRDAMLQVAGQLDLSHGGPAEAEIVLPRRSLYIQTRRFTRNAYAMLFDCANPEQPVAQRDISTTAPQALFLLNNEFVKQQAQALVRRLENESPNDGSERIQRAYQLLFARPASEVEEAIAEQFLSQAPDREQGWFDFAHLLLCSNEFFYVE